MLTFGSLLRSNLRYYLRTHLAVVAGVAVAVGVLTGALLVGDSVRASLRTLFVSRLGKTDHAVVSTTFFREALAEEMIPGSAPLVLLEGMVTNERTGRRRAGVKVYGVDDRFYRFHDARAPAMSARSALLTESLESELEAIAGDGLLLRVERPSDVSRGSLHGIKEDVGRTIRLTAQEGLETTGLPEFSLYPQQDEVSAIFVPLARLQRDLGEADQVNVFLVQGASKDDVVDGLRRAASLEDLGLRVRLLESGGVLSVESSALMLSAPVVAAVEKTASDLSLQRASVFAYLANTLRVGKREIPYSLVAALDPSLYPGAADFDGIVLSDWAASDLGARPGDRLTMEFFVWEDEGRVATREAAFQVESVVPMEGIAGDRDLAPSYPGISETDDLADWEPPFPLDLGRVRDKDEDYWDRFRTTPKAFLPLARGQEIWPVRGGRVTSIRLSPKDAKPEFERALREKLDPLQMGFTVVAAREEGLRASSGATDFGEYFVYFSYFLVVAAVLLAGLFFKLGVEQRHREVGTLLATGFTPARVRRLFLAEGLILSLAGAALGTLVALAYASLILHGLRTWWVDAVGTRLLTFHASGLSLASGLIGGVLAALFATWLTLRYLASVPARSLLAGEVAPRAARGRLARRSLWISVGSLLASFLLLAAALASVVSDVLGFFGAGNLLLVALLGFQWKWLERGGNKDVSGTGALALARLGFRNATCRPGRSLVAIALIAFATFTIVAVDAFRKEASALEAFDRNSGAGGYALVAESLLPLHWDPNTGEGRNAVNLPYPGDADFVETRFQTFRLRTGDDASCLNLYRPQNPRLLAPTGEFLERGGFRFGATLAETAEERANPWLLLKRELPDGALPVLGDANSMAYVLHLGLGEDFVLPREGESPLRLRLVGMLRDSIFQSELLMDEEPFLRHFPEVSGFRYFLVETKASDVGRAESILEEKLEDYGFDASTTASKLASFHRVENTYLATFQSLGGLGLLLGTLGLAAIVLRNVLERRRELALLRAVGYRPRAFALLILSENALLLILGLLTGGLAAALAIAPAMQERAWSFGSGAALAFLAAVAIAGIIASLVAVAAAWRSPLLASLRAE